MSEQIGEGIIRIRTDDSGVDVEGSGKKAGASYSRGFGRSLGAITAAIGGVLAARQAISFVSESVQGAVEAQQVQQRTAQIIEATGGAANITARQVGNLSDALERQTGVDGDVIKSGQNLLLTFRNVKNEGEGLDAIFTRTSKAALDLSAAGFGSVESASLQLGKALNDPLKGISALSRSGVTFTEVQKKQIERFVEQGDLLAAQKIILSEVENQVGGVAEASATAGSKASAAYRQIQDALGFALLPAVEAAQEAFVDLTPAIIDSLGFLDRIPGIARESADAVSGFFSAGGTGGGLLDTLRSLAADVLPLLREGFAAALPIVQDVLGAIGEQAATVLPIISTTVTETVLPALQAFGTYLLDNVVPIIGDLAAIVIEQVIPTLGALAAFVYGTLYPALVQIVTEVASRLKPVFDQLVATFRDDVLPTVSRLVEYIRSDMLPALQPVIEKVLAVVGALARLAGSILGTVLPPLIRFAGFIIRNVVPAVAQIITGVIKVVDGFLSLGSAVGGAIDWLRDLPGLLGDIAQRGLDALVDGIRDIPNRIGKLGGLLAKAGKGLMGAFLDGLKDVGGNLGGIAKSIVNGVITLLNGVIEDLNDLLEFKIPNPLGPDPVINPPNIPAIPKLARGTDFFAGGMAWVGEEGPELVALPTGAQVTPADASARAAAGVTVHIDRVMPHNYGEFERQMAEKARASALGGMPGVAA